MFCQNCGTKVADGTTCDCTSKSASGLSMESLEKSLQTLEDLSKGVRPANSKMGDKDTRTAKKIAEEVFDETKKRGEVGEGDTEENPPTDKNPEKARPTGNAKKGGFMPPAGPPQGGGEEEEEEFDPRRRREEEEEEEEGGGGEPEFKSAKGKKAKKSFAEDLMGQESVRKAVDVSEFLETLVNQMGDYTDDLRADVNKSIKFAGYQQNFNIGLAKAMAELGTIVKGLTEKVGQMGKAPAAVRKSEQNAAAIEKSFAGSDAPKDTLTKSQIASKLTALWEGGDKAVTPADILRAESEGVVRTELREKLGLEKQ